MYTGLSFLSCVKDVVSGLVRLEEVDKIVAATAATTDQEWDEIISRYRRFYWSDNPEECERIARQLISAGKVEQPRLQGKEVHRIDDRINAPGHWLKDGVRVEFYR